MKKFIVFGLVIAFSQLNAECPVGEYPNITSVEAVKKIRLEQQALFDQRADLDVGLCLYRAALAEAQQAYVDGRYAEATDAANILTGLDPSDSWGNLIYIAAVKASGGSEDIPLDDFTRLMSRATTEDRFIRKLAERMVE